MTNCYFCSSVMERTAEDISFDNYISCHKCNENECIKDYSSILWKKICTYVISEGEIVSAYLFFKNLNLWLELINIDSNQFIRVVDNDANRVFAVDLDKDIASILSIPPDVLENKIKTWVLFS